MEIQIVSDLHLEFVKSPIKNWNTLIKPSAPYLALLGDICELKNKALWKGFIERLVPHWKKIFIINGNHEYYSYSQHTWSVLLDNQRQWASQISPNIHILDNESYELDGFLILGTTLWSNVPLHAVHDVEDTLNDYRAITNSDGTPLEVKHTNSMHEKAVRWLSSEINKTQLPIIVLTHHAPLMTGTSNPEYEIPGRKINHAFATDLSGLFKSHVKLWGFGHTHWCTDFFYRSTRVYSNARGYSDADPCRHNYSPTNTLHLT